MSRREIVKCVVPDLWELIHKSQLRIWLLADGAFKFQQGDILSITVQILDSNVRVTFEFKNLWENCGPGKKWEPLTTQTLELEFKDTQCLRHSKFGADIRTFSFEEPETGWIAFISENNERWIETGTKTQ